MPPDPSVPASQAPLDAAAHDADANAGSGQVDASVASCSSPGPYSPQPPAEADGGSCVSPPDEASGGASYDPSAFDPSVGGQSVASSQPVDDKPSTPSDASPWQTGYEIGRHGGMPQSLQGVSPEYQALYDAGYEAGKADSSPEGEGIRKSRPEEYIEERVIPTLDSDGVGYHNLVYRGTKEQLDAIQDAEIEKGAEQQLRGFMAAAGGLNPNAARFPGDPGGPRGESASPDSYGFVEEEPSPKTP
jgi:hypothetical protein